MKKIEDNLLEDLVYSIMDSRKGEKSKTDENQELPDDLKKLEQKKKARYEALLDKYKD